MSMPKFILLDMDGILRPQEFKSKEEAIQRLKKEARLNGDKDGNEAYRIYDTARRICIKIKRRPRPAKTGSVVWIACVWNVFTHEAVAQRVCNSERAAAKFLVDGDREFVGAVEGGFVRGEDGKLRQSIGNLKYRITKMPVRS